MQFLKISQNRDPAEQTHNVVLRRMPRRLRRKDDL